MKSCEHRQARRTDGWGALSEQRGKHHSHEWSNPAPLLARFQRRVSSFRRYVQLSSPRRLSWQVYFRSRPDKSWWRVRIAPHILRFSLCPGLYLNWLERRFTAGLQVRVLPTRASTFRARPRVGALARFFKSHRQRARTGCRLPLRRRLGGFVFLRSPLFLTRSRWPLPAPHKRWAAGSTPVSATSSPSPDPERPVHAGRRLRCDPHRALGIVAVLPRGCPSANPERMT